jgi:hypothetical protein
MKKILTCLTAGLLIIGAQSVMAQTASTTTSTNAPSVTPGTKHHGANPEERKAMMKLLGLAPADLKGLSPEDRKAKIKEAADKYIASMKAKQANGTLTDEQQADLEKVEKFAAHQGHKKAAAPSSN